MPDENLRVLSVVHYAVFGGPTAVNMRIAAGLAETGVELTVALPRERGSAHERLEAAGVRTLTLPMGRLRAKLDPRVQLGVAASFWPTVARLARLVRRERFDVVQANGWENPHALLAGRLAGAAVAAQIVAPGLPRAVRWGFAPMLPLTADAVLATGKAVAARYPLTGGLGERLVTYYPPVDLERHDPAAVDGAAVRERLGFGANDLVVGNVGNFNPMKGQDLLLEAFAMARERAPSAKLVMVGQTLDTHAGYYAGLVAQAHRLGLRPGRDVAFVSPEGGVEEYVAAFDVFALTSRSEGIPTAMLEAMAMAKPVVAFDVGSVREALRDGVEGRVVPSLGTGAAAEAIAQLLTDRGRAAAMGARGRARALAEFGAAQAVERHLAAYRLAVGHAAARRAFG
ncbi:MAG: glycosyltransferase, partial [Chloroflexota bacterium]|nr:glycosyltransferase [Chloroflexota bacterium]